MLVSLEQRVYRVCAMGSLIFFLFLFITWGELYSVALSFHLSSVCIPDHKRQCAFSPETQQQRAEISAREEFGLESC